MKILYQTIFFFIAGTALISLTRCREEYTPPAITMDYDFLVIEGDIRIGADSSFFQLSRSQRPGGNTMIKKETGAILTVFDQTDNVVAVAREYGNGKYGLSNQQIAGAQPLKVGVQTAAGRKYLSDLIIPKTSAPISSLDWELNPEGNGLRFSVSTNDPLGNSKYYRWEFEETWEYRAYFNSALEYFGGSLQTRSSANQINSCWNRNRSTNIMLGTTAAFQQDLISRQPIFEILSGDNRFNVRYSVEVRQFVLDEKAYGYWQMLQKMTEQGGSIFDAQPTELIGNIHAIDDPLEPVIGYISASTMESRRIFISPLQVPGRFIVQYPVRCDSITSVKDRPSEINTFFGSGTLIPVSYGIDSTIDGASRACADCTFYGGTNVVPDFW